MNEASCRTCPYCAESIPVAARVCPRCRQWLTWRSLRHPWVGFLGVQLPVVFLFLWLFRTAFERLLYPRPFFAEVPGAITVINSWINWVETGKGPRWYVTGLLTNSSAHAWRDLEFECRFFDADSNLVDAAHRPVFMTVNPGEDAAFRVVVEPARPREDYHTHQVKVSTARHARSLF